MQGELPKPVPQKPVSIAKFDITDQFGNTFRFPGGIFSTQLYPISMCGISTGEIMEHFGAEHLPTLKDLAALTELAFAAIEGRKLDIPKETQEQALQIFYNNIILAYLGRTPTGGLGIVGERTRDVFSLKDAVVGDNHITVDWLVEPYQVKHDEENFGYEYRERVKARIPISPGIVEITCDGLYDPATGMPFSTKPSSEVGMNILFHKILNAKIVEWGKSRFGDAPPQNLNPLGLAFNYCSLFYELDYRDCVPILREHATYGFSHQAVNARLAPQDAFMVIMVGMDKTFNRDPFCVSVGFNNFGDCGMSVRYIQK